MRVRRIKKAHIARIVEARVQVLRKFSQGGMTSRDAVRVLRLRDHASLLIRLAEARLPLPRLPKEEIDRQVRVFREIWTNS